MPGRQVQPRAVLTIIVLCLGPWLGGVVAAGDNLVPNSSFEIVVDGVPVGWSWHQGRAEGEFRLDDTAPHTGKHSVFMRNSTPRAPHVYSSLRTRIPVVPDRAYTLSCYVRGQDPGMAWVGGGRGWGVRINLPKGTDVWRRVSTSFKTLPDESVFDLLINTDSPTEGFWVDSLQLEQGEGATQYVPPLAPGDLRLVVDVGGPSGIGENLVPNGGFEVVDGNRPKGWNWDPRNTDATFEIVDDARSGKNAIKLTNHTPHGAHIYGQMVLQGGVALTPGERYCLSLYAKSEDPGAAWVGGGSGWWMRLSLSKTNGEWRRFTRSFTAREGDVNFPLMVNTDSPTDGFIVDDIKLEAGERATPFIDPGASGRAAELVLDVPQVLSCNSTEAALVAFAYLAEGAEPSEASVEVLGGDGTVVSSATTAEALTPGFSRLLITWVPEPEASRNYTIVLKAAGAQVKTAFELFTMGDFAVAAAEADRRSKELEARVEEAQAVGRPVDYPRAALAVARRFSDVARRKAAENLLQEAVADAGTIAQLCEQQSRRLREVADGTRSPLAVPNPLLSQIRIADGNFVVDGEPVMLIGGLGYGELFNELDTYRDYGFNVVGDDFDAFSALRMVTSETEYDETAVPRLLKNWDRLHEMNLAIAYNPTLHYFPEWALLKHADITGGYQVDRLPDWSGLGRHGGQRTKSYGGFFPFAIDSPSLRELVKRYYAKLMPAIKDHRAFDVVWLMNEPTYRSTDPHYVELFRGYLQDKFGSVEKLNEAWGSNFGDLSEVGYPQEAGSPGKFDWLTFHQDQVASWFEWLSGQIKGHYPDAVLSNKPMAWTLFDPERGIDFEREAKLWDVPGCDASRSPGSATYAFGWSTTTMLFDFQKSLAPHKPLADHEYHYVHQPNVSSEYVRASYFHSYLHGLRMSQFWVWATGLLGEGKAGAGMKHTAWSQPKVAWGTATSALDLRRLARYIAAFPGRPEVFLYVSRPSLYLDNATHRGSLSRTYEVANCLDATVGFMTDGMVRAGRLGECKLLIVPSAAHVQADVRDRLLKYTDAGGALVLIDECLALDEYGRPHEGTISGADGAAWSAERPSPAELVALLDTAFEASGVSRSVRALTAEGKPAWPVECRCARVGDEDICYVIGLNKKPVTVTLTAGKEILGAEDLISGRRLEGNRVEVKPCDVYMLRLSM